MSTLKASCGCEIREWDRAVFQMCPMHAAAPELLSVLKRLADYAFDTSEYLPEKREDIERSVNAVIAKAEGAA